jgi:hypothetical protein
MVRPGKVLAAAASLRCIVPCGSGRPPLGGVHSLLEIRPSLSSLLDIPSQDCSGVLLEGVEQHNQVARASIKDAVELPAIVASKLSQLALDLRAMREGEMRMGGGKHVESIDLVVEGDLPFDRQGIDEVVDRLASVRRPIVDRLHLPKGRTRIGQRDEVPCRLIE